jgi:hypothetical protein
MGDLLCIRAKIMDSIMNTKLRNIIKIILRTESYTPLYISTIHMITNDTFYAPYCQNDNHPISLPSSSEMLPTNASPI